MAVVLPFYILIDTSHSMRGSRIESVNAALPALHWSIAADPVVSQRCLVSVMAFSTEAATHLPLCEMSMVSEMPQLTASGRSNYGVGLEHARRQILQDVESLRRLEHRILRPCIFFITDGRPSGGWKSIRDRLVDRAHNALAPNIVCYGVAGADVDVLRRLSTRYSLTIDNGTDASSAFSEVFRSIANSVVATCSVPSRSLVIRSSGSGMVLVDNDRRNN